MFILNYDENDGLFDHVVPPTPQPGTADEFVTLTSPFGTNGDGLPIGMGFRVPCIIVSPWTQGGWVCSDVSDHTSCLQFLEIVTGVPCTQISNWRRETASNLTGAFAGPGYNPVRPALPDTNGDYLLAQYTSENLPLPAFPTRRRFTDSAPYKSGKYLETRDTIGETSARPICVPPQSRANGAPRCRPARRPPGDIGGGLLSPSACRGVWTHVFRDLAGDRGPGCAR